MQNSSIGSGPGAVPGLSAPPGPPPDNRSTSRVAERETPGDGQEIRTGAPMPPFSRPKCSPIGSTSDFFRAKTEFQIGRHTLSLPGGRYVTYELQPCTLARMFSTTSELTGPNIDSKCPENNLEIRFLPKWRPKLLPVPVFGHILVLHARLGRFSQKSQKFFWGTFLRYLGSKLKTSKII